MARILESKPRAARFFGFVSQKGGAGKSTLAVHVAVQAMKAGERVLILDADPQGSAIAWGIARGDSLELRVERLAEGERYAPVGDATLVLVDFPPRASGATTILASRLDFALVPVGASALDLATINATARILTAAHVPFGVILNRTPPPRVRETGAAQAALAEMNVPVVPLTVGDRRPFVRALEAGLAAVEFDPRGVAAAEIAALWSYLNGAVK